MTEFKLTPGSEIESRTALFQQELKHAGCDAAIITHHTNLFYFSGTSQSGHLFIPASGDPILMIRKSFARAAHESPVKQIVDVKSLKTIPDIIKAAGYQDLKTIGFELDTIPYNTALVYKQLFPDSQLMDISYPIRCVRIIKSPYEIGLLKESCALLDAVFGEVPAIIREGMAEIELASLFEAGMRKRGYGGCCKMHAFNQDFFYGVAVSGKSGAVPTYFNGPVGGSGLSPANNPHGAGWKRINRDEIIYIDYTCVINGYTADEARMFVIGKLSEHLENAYRASMTIQDEIVKMIKPSVECQTIYQKAADLASEKGLAEHFMGQGNDHVRFVGHGVGLELDELPVFADGVDMTLKRGMTFALEPKFVFNDGAVGIENTYAVTETGIERLTHAPEEIIRI